MFGKKMLHLMMATYFSLFHDIFLPVTASYKYVSSTLTLSRKKIWIKRWFILTKILLCMNKISLANLTSCTTGVLMIFRHVAMSGSISEKGNSEGNSHIVGKHILFPR